jgi:hypothetical protein
VRPKHLRAYFDAFAFRWNRRKTNGVARSIAARVIESALTKPPLPMWKLVNTTKPHRKFAPPHAPAPA